MDGADVYREWAPPPAWRAVVACCWEQRVGADRVQRVLPDGHADILVRDKERIDVVGLYDQVDLPFLPEGSSIRGIRLRPHAVGAAFQVDASELRNRTVSIDDLIGSRRARRLLDSRQCDTWITAIEANARTQRIMELLATEPLETVAHAVDLTTRQLRRVVEAEVGLAPKTYQRVARMQRFVAASERLSGLAVAAAEAGYADQAHMTREIRALAGVTPTRLLDERGLAVRSRGDRCDEGSKGPAPWRSPATRVPQRASSS